MRAEVANLKLVQKICFLVLLIPDKNHPGKWFQCIYDISSVEIYLFTSFKTHLNLKRDLFLWLFEIAKTSYRYG